MHLVPKDGELQFVLDSDDTQANQEFCKRMENYKLLQQGASIFIYNRTSNELLSHYNPFDNTQLICSPNGFALANEFGAKRFLVQGARAAFSEAAAVEEKPENFARDRAFPLVVDNEPVNPYTVMNLAELFAANQNNKSAVYDQLVDLFDRCADFIPEKQAEYQSGGSKLDKFCRFNVESQKLKDNILTTQLFLVGNKNKLIGTISATVCTNAEGMVDVYLYDEVVDYSTQIDPNSDVTQRLDNLYDKTNISLDQKKDEIAKIIEPLRMKLMAPLFKAMREQIKKVIGEIYPVGEAEINRRIAANTIRAFIRAADKRVSSYEQLGCGTDNHDFYVIHGKPTLAAGLVDTYLKKEWAQNRLQLLRNSIQFNLSSSPLSSQNIFSSLAEVKKCERDVARDRIKQLYAIIVVSEGTETNQEHNLEETVRLGKKHNFSKEELQGLYNEAIKEAEIMKQTFGSPRKRAGNN